MSKNKEKEIQNQLDRSLNENLDRLFNEKNEFNKNRDKDNALPKPVIKKPKQYFQSNTDPNKDLNTIARLINLHNDVTAVCLGNTELMVANNLGDNQCMNHLHLLSDFAKAPFEENYDKLEKKALEKSYTIFNNNVSRDKDILKLFDDEEQKELLRIQNANQVDIKYLNNLRTKYKNDKNNKQIINFLDEVLEPIIDTRKITTSIVSGTMDKQLLESLEAANVRFTGEEKEKKGVHAEIKLLETLKSEESFTSPPSSSSASSNEQQSKEYNIGISKLCCGLCDETINGISEQYGITVNRTGTSGAVYPGWRTTDPEITEIALQKIQHLHVLEEFPSRESTLEQGTTLPDTSNIYQDLQALKHNLAYMERLQYSNNTDDKEEFTASQNKIKYAQSIVNKNPDAMQHSQEWEQTKPNAQQEASPELPLQRTSPSTIRTNIPDTKDMPSPSESTYDSWEDRISTPGNAQDIEPPTSTVPQPTASSGIATTTTAQNTTESSQEQIHPEPSGPPPSTQLPQEPTHTFEANTQWQEQQNIIRNHYYRDQDLQDLVPGIVIAAPQNLQEAIDNSKENGGNVAINVAAIGDSSQGGNHWVGLKIDHGNKKIYYIDPLANTMPDNVNQVLESYKDADNTAYEVIPVFTEQGVQVAQTVQEGDVQFLKGNDKDCGPFLVHALNTLNLNNVDPCVAALQQQEEFTLDVDASKATGQQLRKDQLKQIAERKGLQLQIQDVEHMDIPSPTTRHTSTVTKGVASTTTSSTATRETTSSATTNISALSTTNPEEKSSESERSDIAEKLEDPVKTKKKKPKKKKKGKTKSLSELDQELQTVNAKIEELDDQLKSCTDDNTLSQMSTRTEETKKSIDERKRELIQRHKLAKTSAKRMENSLSQRDIENQEKSYLDMKEFIDKEREKKAQLESAKEDNLQKRETLQQRIKDLENKKELAERKPTAPNTTNLSLEPSVVGSSSSSSSNIKQQDQESRNAGDTLQTTVSSQMVETTTSTTESARDAPQPSPAPKKTTSVKGKEPAEGCKPVENTYSPDDDHPPGSGRPPDSSSPSYSGSSITTTTTGKDSTHSNTSNVNNNNTQQTKTRSDSLSKNPLSKNPEAAKKLEEIKKNLQDKLHNPNIQDIVTRVRSSGRGSGKNARGR